MAVNQHDPDWQLVMAQAAISGVEFHENKSLTQPIGSGRYVERIRVIMPEHYNNGPVSFLAQSRWQGAIAALIKLGLFEFLPDAAKNAANRPEMRAANFNRNVLRSTPHDQHDDVRHCPAEGQGPWR